MNVVIGHIDEKIITVLQHSDEGMVKADGYPDGTVFDTIEIESLPVLAQGEEYYFTTNNELLTRIASDKTSLSLVDNAIIDKNIAIVEMAFARLVDEVLLVTTTPPNMKKRRVTREATEAQYKIYNLFQTASANSIIPPLTANNISSISNALKYFKLLSISLDNITSKIKANKSIDSVGDKFINMSFINVDLTDEHFINTVNELELPISIVSI